MSFFVDGVFLFVPDFSWGATETVRLPLTLGYTLIRSLVHVQAFNQPGGRAILEDAKGGDCNNIELWAPELSSEQSLLKIGTNIKIKTGLKVFGTCVQFADWEGTLRILQRVWVDKNTQYLRFTTVTLPSVQQGRKTDSSRRESLGCHQNNCHPVF